MRTSSRYFPSAAAIDAVSALRDGCAGTGDDRHFIEDDGGVFHEYGIGKLGLLGRVSIRQPRLRSACS